MTTAQNTASTILFSPANRDDVEHVIQSNFDDLLKFIHGLRDMSETRHQKEETTQNLAAVVDAYIQVAQAYFATAKKLLEEESQRRTVSNQEKLYRHQQLLDHLQDHAHQLSALITPIPLKEYYPKEQRESLRDLIAAIATRTTVSAQPQPFILPMIGNTFKYVHYNYVDRFGVLNVPPQLATQNASNRNLGILWHESAAYAIAVAKIQQAKTFSKWTNTLRSRLEKQGYWPQYGEQYRESALSHLGGRGSEQRAEILQRLKTFLRRFVLQEDIIAEDNTWQLVWLSEFLEDLYWITVGKEEDAPGELADGVVTVLAGALATSYANLGIGDSAHPPPRLRILVAMSYLCNGDEACINERIKTYVGDSEDVFQLTQADADRALATGIASVCCEILDEQRTDPWLYRTEVAEQERSIARRILQGAPANNQLPNVRSPQLAALNQDFLSKIREAPDLNSLLALDLTTDDYSKTQGAMPWPISGLADS